MRSTLELLLELSKMGHPFLLRLLSLELLLVPSATRDSEPENKTEAKESIVRTRDRFLTALFKHLDPAVPETTPEYTPGPLCYTRPYIFC